MHYEICNRCHLNAICIKRQPDCKRWVTVYAAMEHDLHKLIDQYHKAYDKVLIEAMENE